MKFTCKTITGALITFDRADIDSMVQRDGEPGTVVKIKGMDFILDCEYMELINALESGNGSPNVIRFDDLIERDLMLTNLNSQFNRQPTDF